MIGTIGLSVAGFVAGAAVGALYLGLLWAGARSLAGRRPTLVFLALAIARAALVVGALVGAVAFGVEPAGLVSALVGFVATRIVLTRIAGSTEGRSAWR